MNSMQVRDKLRNIANQRNIDFNILLKFIVFDRFVVRLSNSRYKDNFIIKGGFLISTLFGLENRSTMDIDSSITKTEFSEYNVLKMIREIVNIDLNDSIKFSIKNVESIRDEDEYGGFRINLMFEFECIREMLKLDVATGDPITPSAIECNYKLMLEDRYIKVWSYPCETILAEKLETIFSKLELNSRMKDYYDVYLIYHNDWDNINSEYLINAINRTFEKRKFTNNLDEALSVIKSSSIIKIRWEAYSRRYDYAKNIRYLDIVNCLESIINEIEIKKEELYSK